MIESQPDVIPRREPVIDIKKTPRFNPDTMDLKWDILTEALRRKMIIDPKIMQTLIWFTTTPVDESLPQAAFTAVSANNDRLRRLYDRFGHDLQQYISLPPLNDVNIHPDITHSPIIQTPEEDIRLMSRALGRNSPELEAFIQRQAQRGKYTVGLTDSERKMVTQRYRFARDIKLLALGAEILSVGGLSTNEKRTVLPSGTEIVFSSEDQKTHSLLSNPHQWKRRKQLKDRVYEIEVGEKKYILKEKKTPRHTNTKKGGHREGLTSLEEMKIAVFMAENGTTRKGDVSISWEKPIAAVIYPDGFQFVVFEYEEGLEERETASQKIKKFITTHWERYESEFTQLKQQAEKLKNGRRVYLYKDDSSRQPRKDITRFLHDSYHTEEISFEDFTRAKTHLLFEQTKAMTEKTMNENNLYNSDRDGYAFRAHTEEDFFLERVGFDFEYFEKNLHPKKEEETDFIYKYGHGIGFLSWDDGEDVTPNQEAIYLALLQNNNIVSIRTVSSRDQIISRLKKLM